MNEALFVSPSEFVETWLFHKTVKIVDKYMLLFYPLSIVLVIFSHQLKSSI